MVILNKWMLYNDSTVGLTLSIKVNICEIFLWIYNAFDNYEGFICTL